MAGWEERYSGFISGPLSWNGTELELVVDMALFPLPCKPVHSIKNDTSTQRGRATRQGERKHVSAHQLSPAAFTSEVH